MAVSDALGRERERRRSTYREMMARTHAFSEVCWRFLDVDLVPVPENRRHVMTEIQEAMAPAVGDLTRATREVLLDGPAPVATAAEEVRMAALRAQTRFAAMIADDGPPQHDAYDQAYKEFRTAYLAFIELARQALEVEPDNR